MRPGDKVEVSGYEFTFEGAENVRGPNYGAERGTFTVRDDGQVVAKLSGERRRYFVSGDETTEAGIHTTAMYDLYAVLGEPNGKGGWTTRLYYKPLVPWLWLGSIIGGFGWHCLIDRPAIADRGPVAPIISAPRRRQQNRTRDEATLLYLAARDISRHGRLFRHRAYERPEELTIRVDRPTCTGFRTAGLKA